MARLTKNQVLTTLDGKNIKVIDKLGEGGQGFVYKIKCENKNYALKWYKKPCDDSFYKNLCDNVKRGAPAATFLWPLAITEKDSDGSFGYVMKLCPKRYPLGVGYPYGYSDLLHAAYNLSIRRIWPLRRRHVSHAEVLQETEGTGSRPQRPDRCEHSSDWRADGSGSADSG